MYLVLNLGLKSIRSAIFNEDGQLLVVKSRPLKSFLYNKLVEQDADEWWEKGKEVIKESISSLPGNNKIKFFTVTASSSCVVPVNKNGEPLSKVIMVSDKRAIKENEKILNSAFYKKSFENNKISKSDPSLNIPKILWIKNNEKEVYSKAAYFLTPNDYFAYRFTGNAVIDQLNAEKSFYIAEEKRYDEDLLNDLGIDLNKLPEVLNVSTAIGKISKELIQELGFDDNAEFIITTYDAICAFYGSGPQKVGDGCDVSGTVTSLRVLCQPNTTIKSKNIFLQDENSFNAGIVGGSNNLGGGLIEWAKQAFYCNENEPYGLMEDEAIEAKQDNEGLIFLPYLMGERAPLWNNNARGVFFGLARHHRRKHMIRSIFESAGFSLKSIADEIELSTPISSVRVSGGLARINLVNQIKSDVLGKEILVLDQFETTALGAFGLMRNGLGNFSLSELSSMISVRQVIIPNPERNKIYAEQYALFREIYSNLTSSFELLADFRDLNAFGTKQTIENL